MVLMSMADIVILVIVGFIVVFLGYYLFFRKERSHCSECAVMMNAKKKSKNLKKYYKKAKN